MSLTILVVDDEASHRRSLEIFVEQKLGATAVSLGTGREALEYIFSGVPPRPDLMLLDLRMPEIDGMAVLERLQQTRHVLPVIVITARDDVPTAVAAMRLGAQDFIVKPFSPERLQVSINHLLQMRRLNEEVQRLQRSLVGQVQFMDMVGRSAAFTAAVSLARRASSSTIPVLLTGESGVGKELFARAIHGGSERAGKPFVAVNCGAIPGELAESLLFGHEKGAFTGAHQASLGKFREADGGTLFLDEVGELPPDLQVKLLRALQEGEVQSVGGRKPVKIDVRLISATNQSLQERVAQGLFREDLFYRLHVFPLEIPSLAAREEDVMLLAEHFAARFAALENKRIRGLSAEAMQMLRHYSWPGNVRELENTVFRAIVLAEGEWLKPEDFPTLITGLSRSPRQQGPSVYLFDEDGRCKPMEQLEKEIVEAVSAHFEGSMSEVARQLHIGRSTLYRRFPELKASG